jgi:putative glutamine amidotransferase
MSPMPVILVTPDVELNGSEFGDLSISLSMAYQQALADTEAVPLILGATPSREAIAQSVSRCDGVLLTGGDDVDPRLYAPRMPAKLRGKAEITPDGGQRDFRELLLLDEVFRQRKPLLAICRGHQMLNVALGGTLVADLETHSPRGLNHRRMDQRGEVVHEVRLTPGSLLAKVIGKRTLGVNSTHHQAVARVALPLQAVAISPDGVIEGLELKPATADWLPFLLSVQFHPERLASRHPGHRDLLRAFIRAAILSRDKSL